MASLGPKKVVVPPGFVATVRHIDGQEVKLAHEGSPHIIPERSRFIALEKVEVPAGPV